MDEQENAAATEATEAGDFQPDQTGTATALDGADNIDTGEGVPAGDEPEAVNPVLGETIA